MCLSVLVRKATLVSQGLDTSIPVSSFVSPFTGLGQMFNYLLEMSVLASYGALSSSCRQFFPCVLKGVKEEKDKTEYGM